MRTKILIGVLLLFTQFGLSQNSPKSESKKTEMEQTQFLGLRTTIYKVGNITEAKQWYSKAFKTNPYVDESYYVGFNIGGFELGLLPEKEPRINKIESVVAYWGVDNIQESYDRLIKLGATENEKPYNVGGELLTATVKDPFGNVIGLIYNPYFELKD